MDLLQLLGMPGGGGPGGGIGMPIFMVYEPVPAGPPAAGPPSAAGLPHGLPGGLPAQHHPPATVTIPGSHRARMEEQQQERQAQAQQQQMQMQMQMQQSMQMQIQAQIQAQMRAQMQHTAHGQHELRHRQPEQSPPGADPAHGEAARQRQRPAEPGPRAGGPFMVPPPRVMLSAFEEQMLMAQIIRHIQATSANDPPPSRAADRDAVTALERGLSTEADVAAGACCPVCMDGFEVGGAFTAMPCSHKFHSTCLLPWLNDHNTCPTCRTELPLESDATPASPTAAAGAAAGATPTDVSGASVAAPLPYGGNLQAAMAARDHSAVRTLVRHRDEVHEANERRHRDAARFPRPPSVAAATNRSPAASEPRSPGAVSCPPRLRTCHGHCGLRCLSASSA